MNTKYELLNLLLSDMSEQNTLYKPTPFWEYGSSLIINELEKNDIKDFRNLINPRSFFVPNYSFPDYFENTNIYNSLLKEQKLIFDDIRFEIKFDRLLSGYTQAHGDFRTLKASDTKKRPFIDMATESKIGNPLEQYTFDDKRFSRSFLNYLLGISFLKKEVDTKNIQTVMEIGGGFGTLGEILLQDDRNESFYINADIPPVGFVSSYYLQEVFGKKNVADYSNLKDLAHLNIDALKNTYKAINIASWQVPKLEGKIDLFVNFISFQEMEPDVVKNYCYHIDRLQPQYILLRNMLEGKRKQSENYLAGVKEPILGEDYDTYLPNYKLIASDSEIFGFITEDGFHSQLRIYERI